jgi:hypothetical protein
MATLRAIVLAGAMLYGWLVFWPVLGVGQSSSETVASHTQQLADMGRRVDRLEAMAIGERLTKIETQIEVAAKAAERTNNLGSGALLCLLGLVGERLFMLIGIGWRKKE